MAAAGRRAYFDHAATAPLLPQARDAWLAATEVVGNPAALHGSARAAKALLEDARESIAADLGAHPAEVLFTSSGSQGDSIAVLGGRALRPEQPRVAISAVEHPGVASVRDHLGPDLVVELPVERTARLDLSALPTLISTDVGLVSVQAVNGEVGVIQPITEAAAAAHRVGALFHTDAVQALGQPGIDFGALPIDLASVAAHKIGGPVGIGALLARREVTLGAAGLGSGQERGVVSGTPAVPLAVAFAAALRVTTQRRAGDAERARQLRQRLLAAVAEVPDVRVNQGGPNEQVPGIVHLTIAGTRADDVLFLLDRAGIDASTGAACRAGLHQPSDVVLAMTHDLAEASASIRLSFGPDTTDADLDALVEALPGAIAQARTAFSG